jgi:cold shock CspA family protein
MSELIEGRVKFANSRGFGFIETNKNIDFYFHHTQYKDDWKRLLVMLLKQEQILVEFEMDESATDGPRAKNVKLRGIQK